MGGGTPSSRGGLSEENSKKLFHVNRRFLAVCEYKENKTPWGLPPRFTLPAVSDQTPLVLCPSLDEIPY